MREHIPRIGEENRLDSRARTCHDTDMKRFQTVVCVAAATLPAAASAQLSFLIADRDANALWRVTDVNGDGVFQNPEELVLWYDGTNAAGTRGIDNINTMAVRASDGLVIGADQVQQDVFQWQDLNGDGDCLDVGESIEALVLPNPSGIGITFGTGAAFTAAGVPLMVNAGNGNGPDAIFRMMDLDGDGRFMSANEVGPYGTTGPFGPVANGPFSPQEIWMAPQSDIGTDVGFLRNSSSQTGNNLHGIFRFEDVNNNGNINDPGEFAPWFGVANQSGIVPSAGFPIEPDRARPGALYTHQIATGGVDQIIRARDLDGNGNANDAGEAAIVFSSGEAGLAIVDLVSVENGDLYASDNSGKRIIRMRDENGDGDFADVGETLVVFTGGATVTEVRQMVRIESPVPCPADFNMDGGVDGADVEAFFDAWSTGESAGDVNRDGGVDGADVEYFFARWEAGGCD
jgi:hypothetical protein